jgi:hypothetical protein
LTNDLGLHPAESTWVAAIHADGHAQALGTAVVIDGRRLLTCAHVCSHLVDENGYPTSPLWVHFGRIQLRSQGNGARTQRRRVAWARLSDPFYDLAILHLEDTVPEGVKAARLRRPKPDHLVDRGWWAAGFPQGQAQGNTASGTVGAALSNGLVRLDTQSRYGV